MCKNAPPPPARRGLITRPTEWVIPPVTFETTGPPSDFQNWNDFRRYPFSCFFFFNQNALTSGSPMTSQVRSKVAFPTIHRPSRKGVPPSTKRHIKKNTDRGMLVKVVCCKLTSLEQGQVTKGHTISKTMPGPGDKCWWPFVHLKFNGNIHLTKVVGQGYHFVKAGWKPVQMLLNFEINILAQRGHALGATHQGEYNGFLVTLRALETPKIKCETFTSWILSIQCFSSLNSYSISSIDLTCKRSEQVFARIRFQKCY